MKSHPYAVALASMHKVHPSAVALGARRVKKSTAIAKAFGSANPLRIRFLGAPNTNGPPPSCPATRKQVTNTQKVHYAPHAFQTSVIRAFQTIVLHRSDGEPLLFPEHANRIDLLMRQVREWAVKESWSCFDAIYSLFRNL